MKTTSIGQAAEEAVAEGLRKHGFKILNRNWKTRVCEIDIVAAKQKVVYFVEVKFRSGIAQGSGLDYIGPQKLKRLHFAAQVWVQNFKWDGDYRLLGASVISDGGNFKLEELVELE
jgi:Holliday junction resolvase-like predicted endonuclease